MIPLSVPNISGNEWKYIKDCLDTNWVSSVGSYVTEFEKKVADFCGSQYAVATSNGTSALHIALLLAGVKAGDLVIVPNITFVASVNAIRYVGAEPLLIDIDENTWQMDLSLLKEFINNECIVDSKCIHKVSGKTISAIMPVHVLGNICNMDELVSIAAAAGIIMVEDATEALGSSYKNKQAGTFGLAGCLSFNGNKIITTGGGGMIITDDEALAKRAKHITTQSKSDPDEYYHDEQGYNFRLVNILAAMGVAQMEQLPAFINRKKEIAALYHQHLQNIRGLQEQVITEDVDCNKWLYTIRVNDQKGLRDFLRKKQVDARPFWVPMNQLPFNKECVYVNQKDVSGLIYDKCLSLPCSTGITDDEVLQVAELVKQFHS